MPKCYWKAEDVLEFVTRFEALYDAAEGTPLAPLVARLSELIRLEGADMTRLYHGLARNADAGTLQRLNDIYAEEGFLSDVDGY